MVVAVNLEGVSIEAARTFGGGRIICKFFHPLDGALIASAPEMRRELALLRGRMLTGQSSLIAAGPGAMISVAYCLEAFGFSREAKGDMKFFKY
jgi:hypothetical protein